AQVDAIVGGARLLAENSDRPVRCADSFVVDQPAHQLVPDHAVSDHYEALHRFSHRSDLAFLVGFLNERTRGSEKEQRSRYAAEMRAPQSRTPWPMLRPPSPISCAGCSSARAPAARSSASRARTTISPRRRLAIASWCRSPHPAPVSSTRS